MVVGLDPDSPELSFGNLFGLLGDDLPAIVFNDDPITKMHDSLPMLLFRFKVLVKLYEVRELIWVTCFFLWVLLSEGTSRKQIDAYDRAG
jgi:hypothetical protein